MMSIKPRMLVWIALSIALSCAHGYSQDAPKQLTVEQAVGTALTENLSLQTARFEMQAARARVGAARSGELPQLTAGAEFTSYAPLPTFVLPIPSPPPASSIFVNDTIVGTVAARIAVYTGDRVPARVTGAQAQYDASIADLAAAEADVGLTTRLAYYDVLLQKGQVKSDEENLKAAKDQFDSATARYDAGTAAKYDVLRASTQVSTGEQSLTNSQNQVETAMIRLNKVLGTQLSEVYLLTMPAEFEMPTEDMDALVRTAQSQRAEILAAKARVAAAQAGIRIARSQVRPEIDLGLNYQFVNKPSPVQITGATYTVTMTWPLYNGGKAKSDVSEAKNVKDEAETNLQQVYRDVEQQVRNAYLDLQTSRKDVDTAKARLAQATETYDVSTVRYESGVGTAVEQSDTLAALAAARANQNRAMFGLYASYARLQRALGRVTY